MRLSAKQLQHRKSKNNLVEKLRVRLVVLDNIED